MTYLGLTHAREWHGLLQYLLQHFCTCAQSCKLPSRIPTPLISGGSLQNLMHAQNPCANSASLLAGPAACLCMRCGGPWCHLWHSEHVWDLDTSSSPMREWRTWTLRKKNIHCRKPFFACRECFPYTAPLMLSHLESYLMHAQTHRRELCQVYRTWQIPVACLQN